MRKNSNRGQVALSERDLAIFKAIYEQKTMLALQIKERFFGQTHIKTVRRRLGILAAAGYLEKHKIFIDGNWSVHFYITPKALKMVRDDLGHEIQSPQFKSSSIKHDLILVDIRRALGQREMVGKTITENILQTSDCVENLKDGQSFGILNTDLAIRLDKDDKSFWIPVEWELNHKGKDRILEKLTSYYTAMEIPALIYICASQKIERMIKNCDWELSKMFKPKVFTCLLENVLDLENDLQTENLKNARVIIS